MINASVYVALMQFISVLYVIGVQYSEGERIKWVQLAMKQPMRM